MVREIRPTMADVGRLAGVSATTVSFVINERAGQRISAETHRRVMAAVAELDYRPNLAAQTLRTRRTRTIGFVTDEIALQPPAGQTIAGAHDVARAGGTLLLIVHATRDADTIGDAIADLQHRQVDAIVYAVVGTAQIRLPPSVLQVPTVLVNGFVADDDIPCVLPDERRGGRESTSLLIAEGHRDIAYIAGWTRAWATRQRLHGYRAALRAAGIAVDPTLVLGGNFRPDSGYELTRRLLARRDRPTALLCGNDLMAVGAYFALKEEGLRIPEDVSVFGYDDQGDVARYVEPALTTVRLPYYEMGRWAAEQLLTDRSVSTIPRRTYAACPIVRRRSTCPPPVSGRSYQ